MTKAEKLNKIIEIAIDGGWEGGEYFRCVGDRVGAMKSLEPIIFSHDFLKAYFGKEVVYTKMAYKKSIKTAGDWADKQHYELDWPSGKLLAWQYHAQQLVLAEDYIEYLWKNRLKEREKD